MWYSRVAEKSQTNHNNVTVCKLGWLQRTCAAYNIFNELVEEESLKPVSQGYHRVIIRHYKNAQKTKIINYF